jgi:DNA-directed RNA polymerase specialized sigma24 family protein
MSLLARLAPHLPYVRRYARALTGDQTTGDNYVRAALEALAAGERQLPAEMTPRVALYHVFHAIWTTTGAQLEDKSGIERRDDDASRRLMRIAPRSRQAFLLTALEGFTPSEAAQILDADWVIASPGRPPPMTKRSTPSPGIARVWFWPTSSWPTARPALMRSRTSSSGSTCL